MDTLATLVFRIIINQPALYLLSLGLFYVSTLSILSSKIKISNRWKLQNINRILPTLSEMMHAERYTGTSIQLCVSILYIIQRTNETTLGLNHYDFLASGISYFGHDFLSQAN
jgi:hypothetical protein